MSVRSDQCDGQGECLTPCACHCADDHIFLENDEVVCNCEHARHEYGFCPAKCKWNCQLQKCRICDAKKPQYLLRIRNGICGNCYCELGDVKFTEKQEECPICLETKQMIEIMCQQHLFCFDCWKDHCFKGKGMACPVCRKQIWQQKWIRELKAFD
jgi:hypothetical protein